jgi:hypothetical protein
MKSMSFLHYLAILPLLFNSPSLAWDKKDLECTKGKIRYRKLQERVEENANICFNRERNRLLSKNCLEEKCLALRSRKTERPAPNLSFNQGSPGFKNCWRRGGEPHLLEFFDGKTWWELDRCYFQKDSSFVNTDLLP